MIHVEGKGMNIWVIAFIVVWIIEFALFGMQRATLLISRRAGIEWRGGGELLLPRWFPASWCVIISKWCLLIAMAILWDWRYSIGLAIGGYIFSVVLPIPYSAYNGVFRKRIDELTHQAPYMAMQLKEVFERYL